MAKQKPLKQKREAETQIGEAEVRRECRSGNRNCCAGIWNLYFVLQFLNPRERRGIWNLEGLSRFLESAQLPKSGARRGIWNLEGLGRNCFLLLSPT